MSEATTICGAVMTSAADSLDRFFTRDGVDLPGLSRHLDGLNDGARAAAACALTPGQQAKLFDAARGFRPLTLEHFVPAGAPVRRQVIHSGRNSLPAFKTFEKRFCLPEAGSQRLWGYNYNPPLIVRVTGPGYFVCYPIDAGEVLIDYCEVPAGEPPPGWPSIKPNSAGASRFIYYRTQDTMRGVSTHVSIGRAAREGKVMNNWFVLCRRD
jgi:hypothetical protein